MLLKSDIYDANLLAISRRALDHYRGNVYLSISEQREIRVRGGAHKWQIRFTLECKSSFDPGARTAASGRHMPKASWQAHRDLMRAIFDEDPQAWLKTGLATYTDRDDFLANFEATGDHNVGSRMEPARIRDLAV